MDRYQRGDIVRLSLDLGRMPDFPPVAVVIAPDQSVLHGEEMWNDWPTTAFHADVRIGSEYATGVYRVRFQCAVNGQDIASDGWFEVVPGGDSGGGVISMHSLDRTESRCVVAQLACGRLVLGRSPSVADPEAEAGRPTITF
jgi:hypothetical protein